MQPTGNRRVAAAVLAAGAGSRMGGPKAEVLVEGSRLLDRAIAAAVDAGCAPVHAVVRQGTVAPAPAAVVVNPDPDGGMRSSLVLALHAAATSDALAVLLVDTPGVTSAAIRAVVAAWSPGRIAIGRYQSGRGHPVVMAPDLWGAALEVAGADEGARAFLAAHPDLVDEVPVVGDPGDVDRAEDLSRWRA